MTKALSKDPAKRYETAWKLADDLERFLDGRPIAARPVGPVGRTWRWCRRKPVQAGLAASLIFAVVAGFAGITWNWREAVRQKRVVVRQKAAARRRRAKRRPAGLERRGRREEGTTRRPPRPHAINTSLIDKLLAQAEPGTIPTPSR